MNLNEALRIFGMDENYTLETIKKKYKILILKHHPDKGGCSDTFIKIHEAYHYLLKYTKENNSIPYKDFYLDIHFFMNFSRFIVLIMNLFTYFYRVNFKKLL